MAFTGELLQWIGQGDQWSPQTPAWLQTHRKLDRMSSCNTDALVAIRMPTKVKKSRQGLQKEIETLRVPEWWLGSRGRCLALWWRKRDRAPTSKGPACSSRTQTRLRASDNQKTLLLEKVLHRRAWRSVTSLVSLPGQGSWESYPSSECNKKAA
jgi:hypothetical protein